MVGLSVLSGSHMSVVPGGAGRAARGGACPTCRSWSAASSRTATRGGCERAGVGAVFTPKDFDITEMLGQIVDAVELARA